MTRIIAVLSAKGGVGKTTTTSNIGAALAEKGKSVIVIDGNVTTPNLSLHLGIPLAPITLHDALKGDAHIRSAIYKHSSGMQVIPASLSVGALKGLNINKLAGALMNLLGAAEIILIDGAAGLGKEATAIMEVSDEMIIVTNPDLPALTDALKAIKMANEIGTKVLGVVVNRVRGHSHEISVSEIRDMLEVPVIAVVPEDKAVPKAIAAKMPVVNYSPRSKASREFKRLAASIAGEAWTEPTKRKNWFDRMLDYLAG
ncbi:MAG: cell division ATPase MinD [Candidatus Aenigmatarchaeota archaeon]|nr:cell division ATPase MinD [Candidatus Aenigmarchaeota archaeon]